MSTLRGLQPVGQLGTPLSAAGTRVMVLGAGELCKELIIEFQRLGVETIAVDSYPNAPGMQVAHRSHIIDMLDGAALRAIIEQERPTLVVPEVEAIDTDTLAQLEEEGVVRVAPTANATRMTMNRERIRRMAAEELGVPTSPYAFADTLDEVRDCIAKIGMPCVIKPIMSSSGHGQSVIRKTDDIESAWHYSQTGGRAAGHGSSRVIVEGFVDFDYEITMLTVQHLGGPTYLAPVGHLQIDGDYRESWQPQEMSNVTLRQARTIAAAVTGALGGWGIFGVELFVAGDQVLFSEVSPRPHDTGLVTLVSQDLSEFALHARAVLGLPIPEVTSLGPAASCAIVVTGHGVPHFSGLNEALAQPTAQLRLFGKPSVDGHRRLGVALARGASVEEARDRAQAAATALRVEIE